MSSKIRIDLEFPIHASPSFLYQYISTPDSMGEWFADNVNLRKGKYTFIWEGTEQEASVMQRKTNKFIRFHWEDDDQEEAYFEFRIHTDELTGDVALLITDFAEEDEKEDAVDLWDTQISELKHAIGL